ncbi:hypothetical protein GYMLUDRAFT_70818 [Collybiopsis luxurians FD-317 M1]|nr:hypothetical protein GYMLUDRAFT_70818 [Collybiopsis luxurians FD-317 M1]
MCIPLIRPAFFLFLFLAYATALFRRAPRLDLQVRPFEYDFFVVLGCVLNIDLTPRTSTGVSEYGETQNPNDMTKLEKSAVGFLTRPK